MFLRLPLLSSLYYLLQLLSLTHPLLLVLLTTERHNLHLLPIHSRLYYQRMDKYFINDIVIRHHYSFDHTYYQVMTPPPVCRMFQYQ